ncbi:MAG TPA: DUF6228 family protein [Pyrinomonadaceae bacterium]|nr:DUF6228 family protein [Pyrinomonadaceae bacterium]
MSETFLEIKSASGTSALGIAGWETDDRARRFDYLNVTLYASGLHASTRIYNIYYGDGAGSLPSFFKDMAMNWRGWEGEKRWESVEGDLKMTCTSHPLGHINLAVELHSYLDDPFVWDVRCSLVLESWQLDVLADEARKVFQI